MGQYSLVSGAVYGHSGDEGLLHSCLGTFRVKGKSYWQMWTDIEAG